MIMSEFRIIRAINSLSCVRIYLCKTSDPEDLVKTFIRGSAKCSVMDITNNYLLLHCQLAKVADSLEEGQLIKLCDTNGNNKWKVIP
jgi:hypothetical protein